MSDEVEVERKFLVKTMPGLSGAKKMLIRQGYLTQSEDSVEVRLRQKGSNFFLTVKSGEGLVRSERETTITQVQFDMLWPATKGRRIKKERWTGAIDSELQYELDIFEGVLAPLVLVEVEFTSKELASSFDIPPWFGCEVTEDIRYKNKFLATHAPKMELGAKEIRKK